MRGSWIKIKRSPFKHILIYHYNLHIAYFFSFSSICCLSFSRSMRDSWESFKSPSSFLFALSRSMRIFFSCSKEPSSCNTSLLLVPVQEVFTRWMTLSTWQARGDLDLIPFMMAPLSPVLERYTRHNLVKFGESWGEACEFPPYISSLIMYLEIPPNTNRTWWQQNVHSTGADCC